MGSGHLTLHLQVQRIYSNGRGGSRDSQTMKQWIKKLQSYLHNKQKTLVCICPSSSSLHHRPHEARMLFNFVALLPFLVHRIRRVSIPRTFGFGLFLRFSNRFSCRFGEAGRLQHTLRIECLPYLEHCPCCSCCVPCCIQPLARCLGCLFTVPSRGQKLS